MAKRTKVNNHKGKTSFLGKETKRVLQRQAMKVTTLELRNLANKLECEFRDTLDNLDIRLIDSEITNKKFQINIINKSEMSDTWEFEK